jgi:hypothetical protein
MKKCWDAMLCLLAVPAPVRADWLTPGNSSGLNPREGSKPIDPSYPIRTLLLWRRTGRLRYFDVGLVLPRRAPDDPRRP